MNIRVIAGRYGGRTLVCPPGDRTHPMGERIRNAVFNSLGHDIEDAVILDAFAGTGAVGIEALSRGARKVIFIESDRVATAVLRENIASLRLEDQAKVIATTVSNWLDTTEGSYEVIFADPPYRSPQTATIVRLAERVEVGGLLVLSWPAKEALPELSGASLRSDKNYADARILIYTRVS